MVSRHYVHSMQAALVSQTWRNVYAQLIHSGANWCLLAKVETLYRCIPTILDGLCLAVHACSCIRQAELSCSNLPVRSSLAGTPQECTILMTLIEYRCVILALQQPARGAQDDRG